MADILLFPAERALASPHRPDAPQPQMEVLVADADAEVEDDAAGDGGLKTVANLAAAPSQSLAVLVTKMEVLVTRLAPGDGTDAGLCLAEANLLRSVLRELRIFAMDAVFAAQGAGQWAPISPVPKLQGTSAG